MSAINTNVTSLVAQNALRQNQSSLTTSLTRLSTGLKINTGQDDPSGLIAANNLKDQQAGITQAISNAQQANHVIGTAAGGLTEVSSLLTQLQRPGQRNRQQRWSEQHADFGQPAAGGLDPRDHQPRCRFDPVRW